MHRHMDVRCERCATEYELDDDSVPAGGCPVQCTTCGHTFMVQKAPAAVAVMESAPSPSPPPAEWLLETSDGRLHRFRNLTSLQKWIIERKVTREDKISRTGQAWRRLGEIVELAPFFDVVDEADRARAGAAPGASDELKVEAHRARRMAPSRLTPGGRPLDLSPQPRRMTPPTRRPSSQDLAALDALGTGPLDEGPPSEYDTQVVPMRRTGLKVVLALLLAGGIAALALLYLKRPSDPGVALHPPAPAVPAAGEASASPPSPPSPAPTPLPEAPAAEVAQAEAAQVPAAENLPPAPPPVGSASAPTAPSAPAAGAPTAAAVASYEGLVTEADRLLENGATDKAAKLYDRALKSKPSGVEALSGMGYVMLDKDRMSLATGYFERALAQAPSYGPALFGLAEAQRAEGNDAQAMAAYRRYLQVNASGEDAPAARRQLKLLEEKLAASAPESAAPAPSPSSPPPSPGSVLGEPSAP